MNKKNIVVIILLVLGLLSIIIGSSVAFFNYYKEGSANRVITGNLYLVLENESTSINLTNIFPETKEEARSRNDNTVSFSVTGYNSSNNVLYYEVLLSLGDTEPNLIRFNDKDLRFDLKLIDENNNETMVVDAGSFNEIQDALLYYEVLGANINEEIVRNYELRMWLSDDVIISDTDPNATYAASGDNALSKHYASVKVAVVGDFGNVVGRITYNNDTPSYQDIYEGKQVILASPDDTEGFLGWGTEENGEVVYHPGDRVLLTSNTTLYPIYKPTLHSKIMKLCNDPSVEYVEKYNVANGVPIDTPDGSGEYDVCYYTSELTTQTETDSVRQSSNVVFGDFCWQIVRTTTDGGVKLLYNGHKVTLDGVDTCPFAKKDRINDTQGFRGYINSSVDLSGEHLYGTGFTYSGTTYTLSNTFIADWSGDYDSDGIADYLKLTGTYTCNSMSDSCTTLYYVGSRQEDGSAMIGKYTIDTLYHYSQVGTSIYDQNSTNPASVGYMYSDMTNNLGITIYGYSKLVLDEKYISSPASNYAYYYGDKATWNPSTNMYDLTVDDGNGNDITPTSTIEWEDIRKVAQGMYTCQSTTKTSCTSVYYIVANTAAYTMYSIKLSNNETIDKTVTWTVATDYTRSGDDFILKNPYTLTITLKDWYTNYDNAAYKDIYACSDFMSSTCNHLYYIGLTRSSRIYYNSSYNNYYFSNSVTYNNGSYILDTNNDTTKYQQIWDWYKNYKSINNSHYTCFNVDDNNCGSSVYYVFYTENNGASYVELRGGKKIENLLKEMFNYKQNADDIDVKINRYNSAVKGIVDNWFKQNIDDNNLTSFLDKDAVFCNDRSVINLNGWNPNGGNVTERLQFKNYNMSFKTSASLSCPNLTDRFSVSNEKIAELTYPVGLLTEPERALMNSGYVRNGNNCWLISPGNGPPLVFDMRSIRSTGDAYSGVYGAFGVRPVIVLKSGVEVTGSGTYTNPYVVVGSND